MYMITISTLLALATASATPVPANTPSQPESASIVNVASSSYSSLLVFNPAATSTPASSETYFTPAGVTVPEAATLSFQGDLPSASTSAANGTASGVRVVGQGSGMETGSGNGAQENSASIVSMGWMGYVGVGSALVFGAGLV